MAVVSTSDSTALPKLAIILIGAISVLWGMNWPAMKIVVGELQPWTFRTLCVYGAGLTLLTIANLNGDRVRPERGEIRKMMLVAMFGVTGWHMLTAYGLAHVGGGRAAIIAFTMPLWAMILSVVLLKERLSSRRLIALALGMVGIGLLLIDSFAQLGNSPLGTALIAAAAIAWACATIGTKAFAWSISTIALAGWLLVIGGVPIALVWLVTEAPGDFTHMTQSGVLALLYTTFVALVFCFTSYLRIVRLVPASVAAISTVAIPVVGVISSALLLGEPVGTVESSALALVLAAITLVLWPDKTRPAD